MQSQWHLLTTWSKYRYEIKFDDKESMTDVSSCPFSHVTNILRKKKP